MYSRSVTRWLLAPARVSETQTELIQLLKAVLATVVAWLVSEGLLGLDQPFLAAYSALVTVHVTVHRSLTHGLQTVAATFLGILVAYGSVQVVGYGVTTLGVAVLLGLVLARVPMISLEGITVATTAVFVLTSYRTVEEPALVDRFEATLVGVAAAMLVNLLVVPPLDDHTAGRQIERVLSRLGALLVEMAGSITSAGTEDTDGWITETRGIDDDLHHTSELVDYTRETQSWNPRRRRSRHAGDPAAYSAALVGLEDAVAHTRALARVVATSVAGSQTWDPAFRDAWTNLLHDAGRRLGDPATEVTDLRTRLDEVSTQMSREDLPGLLWPLYGALITSLRNIIEAVDVDAIVDVRHEVVAPPRPRVLQEGWSRRHRNDREGSAGPG